MQLKFTNLLKLATIKKNQLSKIIQDEWTYNEHPELSGWDSKKISDFNKYIIDNTSITGLLIVHHDQIIFQFGDIKENSYIASCRKSVLAMLYGKYVENKTINLETSLERIGIDDVSKLSALEKTATIKNLISAKSGVYLIGSNDGDLREFAPERNSKIPGNYWLYSNWDFNLAGHIFELKTQRNIYDEVETQLAIPLKMQDWDKSLQRKTGDSTISKFPAYHMWFSTRDMARLGLLMLKKGNWKGQQIISENWVEEMLKQRTSYKEVSSNFPAPTEVDFGYGYMWWLFQNTKNKKLNKAYAALGSLGQAIAVYPEINTVVAYKTKAIYNRSNTMQVRLDILKQVAELYNPK